MQCRAPTGAGTPTGGKLVYDNERRSTHWQNAQTSPSCTDDFAYDGEGTRVAQEVNGSTTTYYLSALEEVTGSTLPEYFAVPGLGTTEDVGGTLSFLATDGLSSVSEALSASGTATAQQLFAPYGGARYVSGAMPTAIGFTGQRADATSGLDYYGARYYDPTLGQFTSADSDGKGGLNRYAYVKGNPETAIDPTGHLMCEGAVVAATTAASRSVCQTATLTTVTRRCARYIHRAAPAAKQLDDNAKTGGSSDLWFTKHNIDATSNQSITDITQHILAVAGVVGGVGAAGSVANVLQKAFRGALKDDLNPEMAGPMFGLLRGTVVLGAGTYLLDSAAPGYVEKEDNDVLI